MSAQDPADASLAQRLRREFDGSFAQPRAVAAPAPQRFLAIRVGGDPYAAALAQVAEVHGERRVATLPLKVPELLGVANVRGVPTPIYDLAVFLGYPPGGRHRATLLVRGHSPLGLAFDAVEVNLVDVAAVFAARAPDPVRPHLRGLLREGGDERPLVDLESILETVARRAMSAGRREKEA